MSTPFAPPPTGTVEVASAAAAGAGISTVSAALTPAVEVAGAAIAPATAAVAPAATVAGAALQPVVALPRAGAGEVMESASGKFLMLLALFAMAQLVLAGLIRMVSGRRAEVEEDGIVGI
jgi:hypothetical protein